MFVEDNVILEAGWARYLCSRVWNWTSKHTAGSRQLGRHASTGTSGVDVEVGPKSRGKARQILVYSRHQVTSIAVQPLIVSARPLLITPDFRRAAFQDGVATSLCNQTNLGSIDDRSGRHPADLVPHRVLAMQPSRACGSCTATHREGRTWGGSTRLALVPSSQASLCCRISWLAPSSVCSGSPNPFRT